MARNKEMNVTVSLWSVLALLIFAMLIAVISSVTTFLLLNNIDTYLVYH